MGEFDHAPFKINLGQLLLNTEILIKFIINVYIYNVSQFESLFVLILKIIIYIFCKNFTSTFCRCTNMSS